MFCKHCGKELNDKASVCIGCGIATENKGQGECGSLVFWAYVLAFLMPVVGGIMGIVLLTKNKVGHGIGAIIVAIMFFFLWFGVLTAIGSV